MYYTYLGKYIAAVQAYNLLQRANVLDSTNIIVVMYLPDLVCICPKGGVCVSEECLEGGVPVAMKLTR